jgi:hypothetical protein
MQCLERNRLLSIYRERARDYSHAVATLATDNLSPSLDDFMKRWGCAEFARNACTLAQINIWSHVASHRCLDRDPRTDRLVA